MSNLGFHCHEIDLLEELTVGNGLRRGEIYNLPPDDIPRLTRLVERHRLAWSIHCPLVQLDWYPRPPTWSFLCDVDRDKRDLTMRMVTLTVKQAAEYGADYVVAHFPSPASDSAGESDDDLESIAWSSCERLAELSLREGVPIHLEGVGQSSLITADFMKRALEEYANLRCCFDTAHANLASQYNGFDMYDFETELLPHLGSLHLWNTRDRNDYLTFRHVAVHPSQSPEDGWVDIPRVLELLGPKADSLPIVFESEPGYPEALGHYDYRDGVKWVKELLTTSS